MSSRTLRLIGLMSGTSADGVDAAHKLAILAALLVGAVAIGFSPIFVRLSELGPVATAFWRVGFAVPLLWLAVLVQTRARRRLERPAERDLALIALAAVVTGLWR